MSVQHKDVIIKSIEDGEKIVQDIRPTWKDIKTKVFDEGISNKLYGYIDKSCKDKADMILLRVYGNNTELLVDRKKELSTHTTLNEMGFASPVYCTVTNGYLYGFVEGDILSVTSVRDEHVATLMAKAMARMHCRVAHTCSPVIFDKLNGWMVNIPAELSDKKFDSLRKFMPTKAAISTELNLVLGKIGCIKDPVVAFCHNDLLLANIIHNQKSDTVSFIDYEYGGTNYRSFDIGNHFNEYAGVETVDYSLYPDTEYQKWWIKAYLEEYHKEKGLCQVTDNEVDNLYKEVNFFALASHLWWGIWAIIQALNSDIDFDFGDYSRLRFEEYLKQKDIFLALLQ